MFLNRTVLFFLAALMLELPRLYRERVSNAENRALEAQDEMERLTEVCNSLNHEVKSK